MKQPKKNNSLPLLKKGPLSVYGDIIAVLLMILTVSALYYGIRVLTLTAVSVTCTLIFDNLLSRLFKIHHSMDLSPVVTGMIIAMLMPASAPYYVAAAASAFGITAAKIPFGGTGRNILNPAALGFCFASLVFKDKVYSYPAPGKHPELFFPNVAAVKSPAEYVAKFSLPTVNLTDLISGRFPSAIGCGFAVLIIAGFAVLAIRRRNIIYSTVGYIATIVVFAAVAPRIPTGIGERIMLELCSGCVLFSGVFMLNDPTTSPRTRNGKIFSGVITASLTMMLSFLAGIIFAAPFAIIIANIFSRLFDSLQFIPFKKRGKQSKPQTPAL